MEKVKRTTTAKKGTTTRLNGIEPKETAAKRKPGTTEMTMNGTAPKKATAPVKRAKSNLTHMISHEEIARLAHRYWSERGRQHGRDAEDWFRAERELLGKAS